MPARVDASLNLCVKLSPATRMMRPLMEMELLEAPMSRIAERTSFALWTRRVNFHHASVHLKVFFFFLPNWGNRWDTTWLFWEIAALLEQFLASTQAKRVSRAKSSEIGVDNSLFYILKLCKKLSLL